MFDEKKVKELPMVDVAFEVLKQSKKNFPFYDLVKEISTIKGMKEEDVMDKIAQLFTEMNIDGRFIHVGQNEWGLKSWFPVDQTENLHFLRDEEDEEEYDEDFDNFDSEEVDVVLDEDSDFKDAYDEEEEEDDFEDEEEEIDEDFVDEEDGSFDDSESLFEDDEELDDEEEFSSDDETELESDED